MSRHVFTGLVIAVLLGNATTSRGEGRGDEVVVVYNTRVAESKDVAQHYAEVRHVPGEQVFGLDLPNTENISREDYRDELQKPLFKLLEDRKLIVLGPQIVPAANGRPQQTLIKVIHARVRYVVLCYGVPLRITEDTSLREESVEGLPPEMRRNEAAVDNELACLPVAIGRAPLTGPIPSPFYGCTNARIMAPAGGLLIVARLDGPTAAIARGLVDKAVEAEKDGLWGRAYFDMRGLTNSEYQMGDDWIRAASEVARDLGFETVVDHSAGAFPANFPLSQAALYAGWYDANASGPFARPTVEFMPGAFAYHLHSFSAESLRTSTRFWAGPLLAKGATATMGCVAEPFLPGTPDIGIFFQRFAQKGFTFGEAAYASQRFLSWQVTVVGDPLYRPFTGGPTPAPEELEQRHDNWAEWSFLRAINLRLLQGTPVADAVARLEKADVTSHSAVLQEKLADLTAEDGKPERAVEALQEALKLAPSPQQRVRVMLSLGSRLASLSREPEAYAVYQEFLVKCPDYPDMATIYRRLLELAQKLGKKDDAEKYSGELDRLVPPQGAK